MAQTVFIVRPYGERGVGQGSSESDRMARVPPRDALERAGVDPATSTDARAPSEESPPRDLVIVSTGHRIDAPGREEPRFPKECEAAARAAIRRAVERARAGCQGTVSGISGLASGSDILFHEVCAELGIATRAVLPLGEREYLRASVQEAGGDWVDRYRKLCRDLQPRILGSDEELPEWIANADGCSVFQRGNLWALESAFTTENADVTLIAFWNGQRGDGPGGTEDMVRTAEARGAEVIVIDSREVCGLV